MEKKGDLCDLVWLLVPDGLFGVFVLDNVISELHGLMSKSLIKS